MVNRRSWPANPWSTRMLPLARMACTFGATCCLGELPVQFGADWQAHSCTRRGRLSAPPPALALAAASTGGEPLLAGNSPLGRGDAVMPTTIARGRGVRCSAMLGCRCPSEARRCTSSHKPLVPPQRSSLWRSARPRRGVPACGPRLTGTAARGVPCLTLGDLHHRWRLHRSRTSCAQTLAACCRG